MEKQETEIKWKLERETGNGNWKRKWGEKTYQSLVQYFLHRVLSHYLSILLSNRYVTGFMSHALPLLGNEAIVPRAWYEAIICFTLQAIKLKVGLGE